MTEPLWIEERDALALHDRLLALHGGTAGWRAGGLLHSALARPRQMHAYANAPDAIDLAAAYTVGLVGNHPFIGGNKRTMPSRANSPYPRPEPGVPGSKGPLPPAFRRR